MRRELINGLHSCVVAGAVGDVQIDGQGVELLQRLSVINLQQGAAREPDYVVLRRPPDLLRLQLLVEAWWINPLST
jgi:hypothetical protein